MTNLSVERTYNVGQYQSLKVWVSGSVDITNKDDVLNAIKYLSILLDIGYFNYISTSPVYNNTLSKEVMIQFKEALDKFNPQIIFIQVNNEKEEQ